MPSVIDFEMIHVDNLSTIWSPVQGELSPEEHAKELEDQATASLLAASPIPEQMLRILLNEAEIHRVLDPPRGFDPDVQGEWEGAALTFAFRRSVDLVKEQRQPDRLVAEYKIEGAGNWRLEIAEDSASIARI